MKERFLAQALVILTICLVNFSALVLIPSLSFSEGIIIDHTCTDLDRVPEDWIIKAKSDFRLSYGHTSHGSQIVTGMDLLKGEPGSLYWFDRDGTLGGLSLHDCEPQGDLGEPDRTAWAQRTRDLLNKSGNDRNMIMWSWCGQVSWASEADINTYLDLMKQLEEDYPGVTFVYITGHLDGTGEDGNLNRRNNQIRDFCTLNSKILFDFADIESYDPDGNYYLDLGANDQCDYDGGNWAEEWCAVHSGECASCDCAHSHCLNCQLKGRAFWWMMARLAGWNGGECLPAPSDLTAIGDSINHEIALSWADNSAGTNEDSFIIQRQENAGAWDNNYATVLADTNTFTDTGLLPGTYKYRAVARLNDDGSGNPCDSPPSNIATAVIAGTEPPAAPSDLCSELSGFDITLTWTDNSDNEESFVLERKTDSGSFTALPALPAGTQTYVDAGLLPLHTYTYRVKALNNLGESDYSNETSVYIAEEYCSINLKQGVDGYTGCKDVYLDYGHPDDNYGDTPYMEVLNNPKCNFVLLFDLPPEVMNKKIIEAKLLLYCWSVSGWQASKYLDLYLVTEDWDEASATWNKRNMDSNWTIGGGTFYEPPLASSLIPNNDYYPEFDITGPVQQWADGSKENYGVILVNDTVIRTGIKASEYSEYARPSLMITYTNKVTCPGDFDSDGDVDGSDLAVFAANFGRTDCTGDCPGDFDSDGDVDGSDLAVFAANFGRTDC